MVMTACKGMGSPKLDKAEEPGGGEFLGGAESEASVGSVSVALLVERAVGNHARSVTVVLEVEHGISDGRAPVREVNAVLSRYEVFGGGVQAGRCGPCVLKACTDWHPRSEQLLGCFRRLASEGIGEVVFPSCPYGSPFRRTSRWCTNLEAAAALAPACRCSGEHLRIQARSDEEMLRRGGGLHGWAETFGSPPPDWGRASQLTARNTRGGYAQGLPSGQRRTLCGQDRAGGLAAARRRRNLGPGGRRVTPAAHARRVHLYNRAT